MTITATEISAVLPQPATTTISWIDTSIPNNEIFYWMAESNNVDQFYFMGFNDESKPQNQNIINSSFNLTDGISVITGLIKTIAQSLVEVTTIDAPPTGTTPANATALWQFDEGTGTTTADSSGNGYTGTLTNGPVWVTGLFGNAINFNNSSAYVQVPSVPVGSNWTIQTWTLFPINPTGSFRTFIQTAGGQHHILVDPSGLLGQYNFGFFSTGFNVSSISAGWHLLSAVGSGGSTQYYIDSTFVGTAATQLTTPINYIGNYVGGGQNWGIVDSTRIFDLALTATQIAADATSGLPLSLSENVPNINEVFYWMSLVEQPIIDVDWLIKSDLRTNCICNFPPQIGGATIE